MLRWSRWILTVTAVLAVASALRLVELRYTDDITGFLPTGDPEVARFWKVSETFGGLNIGLVGLEVVPDAPDAEAGVFTTERLKRLVAMTDVLKRVDGVAAVTSLATVRDFRERTLENGEKQSVVSDLIPSVPATREEAATLKAHVLGSPHLVGALVSADAQAALVLCNFDDRQSALDTAKRVRDAAKEVRLDDAGLRLHLGGAPFINEGLATAAGEDIAVFGPLVAAVVLLIVLASLRNAVAAALAIVPVGVAILLTLGLMAALNEPLTLVSSSLPVVLLALGSAYPIHVVSRYFDMAREHGTGEKALRLALGRVGPPVFVAGLTTIAGFVSFVTMDIVPMRVFGLFMSAGVAIATVIGLVVVPAVLCHVTVRPPAPDTGLANAIVRVMDRMLAWIDRRLWLTLGATLALASVFAVGAFHVHADMSTTSYFTRETDAVRADRFLGERFGGSQFLQLPVEGPIRDPLLLEEVARLEDYADAIPGVSNVRSVTEIIRLANQALFSVDALPTEPEQVETLSKLADDDPGVRLLVTKDWDSAVVQVRLGTFDTALADRIADKLRERIAARGEGMAAVRWAGLGSPAGVRETVLSSAADDLTIVLYGDVTIDPAKKGRIRKALEIGLSASAFLGQASFKEAIATRLEKDLVEDELVYLADAEAALPGLAAGVLAAMAKGPLGVGTVEELLLDRAEAEERTEALAARAKGAFATSGFARAAGKVHRALRELQDDAAREALGTALRSATTDAPEAWQDRVRSARARRIANALTEDTAFLPVGVAKAAGADIVREAKLSIAVSGYPVLWAGMNHSIRSNQVSSVAMSFGLIILTLALYFRSVLLAFVSMLPTGFTLVFAFGGLGLFNVPIDLGSTMIASITFGVGIDYAVHYVASYRAMLHRGRREAGMFALGETGPSVVINALEVGLGFGLLSFGVVAPVARFGMLTGETMLLSAAGTLMLLPPLLWRLPQRAPAVTAVAATATATPSDRAALEADAAREKRSA